MKIVIINSHPSDGLGGSEIQSDIIANELHKLGHNVVFLAINGKQHYNTIYKVKPVNFSSKSIGKATIEENPDIVYWRNNKHRVFRSAVKIFYKNGIPVVFVVTHINSTVKWIRLEPNGSILKQFFHKPLKTLKSRWNHGGFKWVSGVIVNNKDHLGRLEIQKEIYIPNSNLSEKVEFNWKKPYICWVANLKQRKRPELCVEVAKKLESKYDLLVVGDIQDKSYLWFTNPKNIPKNLVYLGPKTILEVNGIIASSICLIHTCYPEGFPGNFIQAWLQGKPVVSYEIDPGDLIESEKLGFISGSNLEQFITDIKKLAENPILNQEIGKRAKSYAEKHFQPKTNAKILEQFLLGIIQRNASSRESKSVVRPSPIYLSF